MKVIFAGTPQFAAVALEALIASRVGVVAVLTQPDRPAGRGMRLLPSPVKQLALREGVAVLQPDSLKAAGVRDMLAGYGADVMVVAAYGLILPSAILKLPRYGCLNIHASLLPRWRGAAPIQRALLAGDRDTGVTIMQMDEGLDTGAMLLKKSCPIAAQDNAQTLHDRLAELGAAAIVEALQLLQLGRLNPVPQDESQATYAAKLSKAEAKINWALSAVEIERAVRAYYPFPVASALLGEVPVKILQTSLRDGLQGEPGVVLAVDKSGIVVACGQDALCLEVLQRPNARAMPAAQFIQGCGVRPGDRFVTHG